MLLHEGARYARADIAADPHAIKVDAARSIGAAIDEQGPILDSFYYGPPSEL
jgi:hypothetical protein